MCPLYGDPVYTEQGRVINTYVEDNALEVWEVSPCVFRDFSLLLPRKPSGPFPPPLTLSYFPLVILSSITTPWKPWVTGALCVFLLRPLTPLPPLSLVYPYSSGVPIRLP